jgi:DnaD/phage-associated family protein
MLDEFIQNTLSQIDDLAELKVSLVALRWLEQKQSTTASVTLDELGRTLPLRDGLGIVPTLTLEYAMRKALARGTFVASSDDAKTAKIFANNQPSRELIEAIQNHTTKTPSIGNANQLESGDASDKKTALLILISGEIERLEMIDAYYVSAEDADMVEEWLARGYSQEEIVSAVRAALRTPRPSSAPPRGLRQCEAQVKARLPRTPSAYYRMIITKSEALRDEIVAFRELSGRLPTGHEFNQIRAAIGLYGLQATLMVMRRVISKEGVNTEALLPILAEQQEAEMSLARRELQPDLLMKEIVQLYESTIGMPATSNMLDDMRSLLREMSDIQIWRAAFQLANTQNKRNWAYIRAVVRNPTPDLLVPLPINETAKHAYELYHRRVGRLDVSVAREINELAMSHVDISKWEKAIDKSAAANALNWNYIKAVLTRPAQETKLIDNEKDGKRKNTATSRSAASRTGKATGARRAQVEFTDEERAADEERARAIRTENAARKKRSG